MNDQRTTINDSERRILLRVAAKLMALVGFAFVGFVLVSSLFSTERKEVEPVVVDVRGLQPGELRLERWERRGVLILHRTEAMLDTLAARDDRLLDPSSEDSRQPEAARNTYRALQPEYFVAIAHGTDLGCELEFVPQGDAQRGWPGGFRDRCRGSRYDLAGRVYKDQEAYRNLEIPPHRYLPDGRLLIGAP